MLRQSAFITDRPMLKGCLHCHTSRTDGRDTPEDVIAIYEENGYDFLALTDHRLYNYRNFLPGSKLTIIPGMEMDRNIAPTRRTHCFHSVWLGREKPHNPYEQDETFERGEVADQFEFQPLLDEAHEKGHLTICCHPQWSGTFNREFDQLKGNFAIELWNTGCVQDCECDINNGWIWDDLLMQGQRIYGVATDDAHHVPQYCKGWVRVNADNHVDSILDALNSGAFYSSTGPEIYDFWIDDDRQAHVKCSPCTTVQFHCATTIMTAQRAPEGETVTEMTMSIPVPDYFPYLRVEVRDADGHVAWSNPIFLK